MKFVTELLFFAVLILMAISSSGLAGEYCERQMRDLSVVYISLDNTFQKTEDFNVAHHVWLDQLLDKSKCNGGDCAVFPPSMDVSFNRNERATVTEAADKLRAVLMKVTPRLVSYLSTPFGASSNLESITQTFRDSVETEYGNTAISSKYVQTGLNKINGVWNKFQSGLDLSRYTVASFADHSVRYLDAMDKYADDYGHELVNRSVVTGAGFGNLATQIILDSMKLAPKHLRAVDSLSLLHPLTDDALDQGKDISKAMKKISELLNGGKPTPEDDYERAVLGLVTNILEEYPPEEYPMVRESLLRLHQAQLKSIKIQKDPNATDEDILKITIEKGGYTSLALAQVAMGTLTKAETEFFFKSGILFQLGDDLLDLEEDKADGTNTLWTRAVAKPKEFQKIFNLYSGMETYLESEGPRLLAGSPGQVPLMEDLTSGFRFYMLSAFLNPSLDKYIQPILQPKFPLGARNSRSVAFNLFKVITQTPNVEERLAKTISLYGEVFDKHFLKGQYAAFATETAGRKPLYRIWSWNPLFPLIKFSTRLENYFRNMSRRPSMRVEGQVIIWSMLFTHVYLLGQTDSPMVRALAPVMAFMGVTEMIKKNRLSGLIPMSSIMISTAVILQHLGIYFPL